jgi:hypothetical protein
MILHDPLQRLSASQCLDHSYFNQTTNPSSPSKRIKMFTDKRKPRLEHITIPEEPLNFQNSIEMDEQFYLVWEFGKQLGVLKKCILYAETFFKVYLTLEPNAVSNIKIVAISCLAIAASLYDMYDFSYVGGVEFYGKGHDHLAHCIVRILGVTKGVLSDLEL